MSPTPLTTTPLAIEAGVVLYDGAETLPMGEGLWAVPLASLWLS